MMKPLQKLSEKIKKESLCVLATSSPEGKPEAAVVVYAPKDDLTLIISTDTKSRKYKNISKNNKVSVVIGGTNNDATIQIDGEIHELAGSESTDAKKYILTLHPKWADYFNNPDTDRFFEIKPLWARCSDFSTPSPEIFEKSDFVL